VIGGGSRAIRPGAISLAHRGVLFMDEAPEFRPAIHDALRQPLESGEISIRRADSAARFPSCFQLVLAANPCPCSSVRGRDGCRCSPDKLRRYQSRISGPVLDRIDITHRVATVTRAEMRQPVPSDQSSAAVGARIHEARGRQAVRFAGLPWRANADVPSLEFRARCHVGFDAAELIESEVASGYLSQRGADRVARLSWTIADLAGLDRPGVPQVAEALRLRQDAVESGRVRRHGRVS
jgi:magnesium chelatase family protein